MPAAELLFCPSTTAPHRWAARNTIQSAAVPLRVMLRTVEPRSDVIPPHGDAGRRAVVLPIYDRAPPMGGAEHNPVRRRAAARDVEDGGAEIGRNSPAR